MGSWEVNVASSQEKSRLESAYIEQDPKGVALLLVPTARANPRLNEQVSAGSTAEGEPVGKSGGGWKVGS